MHIQALTLSLGLALAAFAPGALAKASSDDIPDLNGTYNGATLTPLTRPKEFGDNLYLTPEEAERLKAEEAARIAESNNASDPDREAPPAGGDGSSGAAGNVGGYNTFWIDRGTDALEVDGKFRTSIIIDPPNGQFPPLTPAAQGRMAKLLRARRANVGKAWWLEEEGPGPYDNMEQRNAAERCLASFSGATPSIPSLYNNFKRIVQTEDSVMIMIEMIHDARIVRLNSTHKPPHVTSLLGDSIGWYEDGALVVETTNFSGQTVGYFNGGKNMTLVEKFTKTDNGDILYNFTVNDPDQWTAPWTGEYLWSASSDKVYEYACHEGNYALGNIMRGARLLEQDAQNAGGSAGGE